MMILTDQESKALEVLKRIGLGKFVDKNHDGIDLTVEMLSGLCKKKKKSAVLVGVKIREISWIFITSSF